MSTFLFLLKSYPDIDHMAPMIWNCLEHGDETLIAFEQPYDYVHDYRIQFLLTYERCRVVPLWGVASSSRIVRFAARVRWQSGAFQRLLSSNDVRLCFFEWGPGIPPDIDRSLFERVRRRRAPVRDRWSLAADRADELVATVSLSLLLACRAAGVPAIAFPHAVSTKMEAAYNQK